MHFWVFATRVTLGFSVPRKYGLNWFMPALANRAWGRPAARPGWTPRTCGRVSAEKVDELLADVVRGRHENLGSEPSPKGHGIEAKGQEGVRPGPARLVRCRREDVPTDPRAKFAVRAALCGLAAALLVGVVFVLATVPPTDHPVLPEMHVPPGHGDALPRLRADPVRPRPA